MKKVLYYVNQFFGQIGGEDQAGIEPQIVSGPVGPALAFNKAIQEVGAEVSHTIICGDNFFNEHKDQAQAFIRQQYEAIQPDLVVAGPAFNAGRYGMAIAGVVEALKEDTTVLTGMYPENPGVPASRSHAYIVETKDSAGDMRKSMPKMIQLAKKILTGQSVKPQEDGYMPQGRRLTIIVEKTGAQRAADMLLKRLKGEDFETELPMPEFDHVDPAAAIDQLSQATIALVTTGGIVPQGNPDRLQSASAQKWVKYDISQLDALQGEYMTVHGGFDPVYCNERADRVAPLDQLVRLQSEGRIGQVYKYFYSTTGTGTSVANSEQFGQEIGQELADAGVDGVILTST